MATNYFEREKITATSSELKKKEHEIIKEDLSLADTSWDDEQPGDLVSFI
jgi:hypothetical protein